MTLHRIAEDLRDHLWYEHLFVTTIADVEEYVGRWTAFEQAVATSAAVDEPTPLRDR